MSEKDKYCWIVIETIAGSDKYDIKAICTTPESGRGRLRMAQNTAELHHIPYRYYLEKAQLDHLYGTSMFRNVLEQRLVSDEEMMELRRKEFERKKEA